MNYQEAEAINAAVSAAPALTKLRGVQVVTQVDTRRCILSQDADERWVRDYSSNCAAQISLRCARTGAWSRMEVTEATPVTKIVKELLAELKGRQKSVLSMRSVERNNRW